MPEVPYGGILGEKLASKIFLDYDVILMWLMAFKNLRLEISML